MKSHDQVAYPHSRLYGVKECGASAKGRARPGSLQEITDYAVNVTRASGAALAIEKASGEIVCAARSGDAAPGVGAVLNRTSGISAACVRTGEVQHCADTQNDARVDPELCRRLGIRSVMVVPLRRNGRVAGLLSVYSPVGWNFDVHDVAELEDLQSVALALADAERANARLAPQLIAGVERGELLVENAEPQVAARPHIESAAGDSRELRTEEAEHQAPRTDNIGPPAEPSGNVLAGWAEPPRFVAPLRALAFFLAIIPIAALAVTAFWLHAMFSSSSRPQPRPAVLVSETPASTPATTSTSSPAPRPIVENPPLQKTPALPGIGVAHVQSIDSSSGPGFERVTITFDHDVRYTGFRLDRPERVCFDLRNARFAPGVRPKTIPVAGQAVRSIRSSQYERDVVRVVLDLNTRSGYAVEFQAGPPRLVIDVSSGRKEPLRTVHDPAAAPRASTQGGTVARELVIALDPGHGGDDKGAVGRQGLQEKQLVLDVALRLGALLERELGAKVIYTRRDDRSVPLEQRAAAANEARADLLISIHGNGSNDPLAEGVETYYLDVALSREGAQLAQRENQGRDPLSRSVGGEKLRQSRAFAGRVQDSLYAALRGDHVRNRGVRAAPLVILRAAQMPAILVEISFLSSPQEERRLDSGKYRQQIAEALYTGIRRQVAADRGKGPGDKSRLGATAAVRPGPSRGL